MIGRRKHIFAVVVAFALTAAVHADMVLPSDAAGTPCHCVSADTWADAPAASLSNPLVTPGVVDLNTLAVAFVREGGADIERTGATPESVRRLANDRGSLELCLYALMGLGLCKTAPWVKKLSFGSIPDWYHHSGPYQIGGSHVIGPDCLCSVAVCFVQPGRRADEVSPRFLRGTIVSLLRESQFTLTMLASRGPPALVTRYDA